MQNAMAKDLNIDPRHFHYNVRQLEGFGLVKVQKAIKSNVVCLSRHYNACLRALANLGPAGTMVNVGVAGGTGTKALNYAAVAERVVAALRAARGCTLLEGEVRITVGMKGNKHKTVWGHVRKELASRGAISVRARVQGKVQTCLHLKTLLEPAASTSTALTSASVGNESVALALGPRVRAEETVQQQIFDIVVQAGEAGITHTEINRKLRVLTKLSYQICCTLVAENRLFSVAETINSQVHYRLIGPSHYRAAQLGPSVSPPPPAAEPSTGAEGAGAGSGTAIVPAKKDTRHLPRTIQQQKRRDKVVECVNSKRMVWVHDVQQWMRSELKDDVDKKVLTRIVTELDAEGKLKLIRFSTRTSLGQSQKQTPAAFAIGAPLYGPDVEKFVEARAVKRRRFTEPAVKPDLQDVDLTVDHLPGTAGSKPRAQAAENRSHRLEAGFIEGRVARAKALHLYLWSSSCNGGESSPSESNGSAAAEASASASSESECSNDFSMESILKEMKIRDYAQLLGIMKRIPKISKLLEDDVKVVDMPEPWCKDLIKGQPTFYSFKSMLQVLIKLGLVKPRFTSGDNDSEERAADKTSASKDKDTPDATTSATATSDENNAANANTAASFTHCSLIPTVRLPGNADQPSGSGGGGSGDCGGGGRGGGASTEPRGSSHLALGTVAQFGITSDTARDRAYTFDRDGELHEYWSDLQSFVTERSRACAGASQSRDCGPAAAAGTKATPEEMARQEGLPDLPELFRLRSWSVEKLLSASQRTAIHEQMRKLNLQLPLKLQAIVEIAQATKIALVPLVAYFNDTHQSQNPTAASRLMPIRNRSGAGQSANASSAVSGRARKSRKRQTAGRGREPQRSDASAAAGAGGMAHEPDHVAAYMASAQAERRQDAAVNDPSQGSRSDSQIQVAKSSADEGLSSAAKPSDFDDERVVVSRRAAKLQWNSQMDLDLALAYVEERRRVSRSDRCYRVSWANIGDVMNVSAPRARRRWAALSKDPKFKQAITMSSDVDGGESQASMLQLILQGGTERSEQRLPDTLISLHRNFHVRDGSAPVNWAGHVNPKLSALMLALKAILLVPEDQCERSTAISLLTRFENNDIENAIRIMKAQHLLTSVKGAKLSSRAFRLSTKFHESRKLVTENYQRDIFDCIRAASTDIQGRIEPAADSSSRSGGALLGDSDVDPVTGGGYAAAVLGRIVTGALALNMSATLTLTRSHSRAEEEVSLDDEHDADAKSSTAPHASILSHLLLVGAVQESAEGGAGGSSEAVNVSVQLPSWEISMRPVAGASSHEPKAQQHNHSGHAIAAGHAHAGGVDWSGIELTEQGALSGTEQSVQLPEKVLSAARELSLPTAVMSAIFSAIHSAGREGATIDGDIVHCIQHTDAEMRSTVLTQRAAERAAEFLVDHSCVVRVSAWDHHRYVSSILDHFWAVPRQPRNPKPEDDHDAGMPSLFTNDETMRVPSAIGSHCCASLCCCVDQGMRAPFRTQVH